MAREYSHKYYLRNKEKINEKSKKYYRDHKERMSELSKKNNLINKQRYLAAAKKHRQKKIDWFWETVSPYCRHCGYRKTTSALQIHHLDPLQKENVKDTFSEWVRKRSLSFLKHRLSTHSFLILCANCHIELHAGLWSPNREGWDDSVYFIE